MERGEALRRPLETPLHVCTCARVREHRRMKGILVNLSTSGAVAAGDAAVKASRVGRADKSGKQALPPLTSTEV